MLWNPEVYGHYSRLILRVRGYSIAMDSLSIGIKADDVGRNRIILREGNYKVWSTVLEQMVREKNLWNHVMSTYVPPLALRARALRIVVVAADPILGIATIVGVAKII